MVAELIVTQQPRQMESDYSTDSSPQADVMPMEASNGLSLRTGDMKEGVCVRRSALVDNDGMAQDELEPGVEKAMRARLAELVGPLPALSPGPLSDADHENGDEQEFEFRMFSGGAHKIVLREDEGMGDGAFVNLRDPRIFAVPPAVGQRKAEFDHTAMTGEEVMEGSRRRAWGLEVPWRVTVLKVTGSPTSQVTNIVVNVARENATGKKTKHNKKRRIILRERAKKAEELARCAMLEKQNREEADKEKRSRKNREKKLKKRAKDKAIKAVGIVTTGTEEVSG